MINKLMNWLSNGSPKVKLSQEKNGDIMINLKIEELLSVCQFLKKSLHFRVNQLIDVVGVHYPEQEKMFEVVYVFQTTEKSQRILLKVSLGSGESLPSLTSLYASANWYEREVYDMFGIHFEGHPDLRRLLTDYGFEGHPLRKDFPLVGYQSIRYDEEVKTLIQEPVDLSQSNRRLLSVTVTF